MIIIFQKNKNKSQVRTAAAKKSDLSSLSGGNGLFCSNGRFCVQVAKKISCLPIVSAYLHNSVSCYVCNGSKEVITIWFVPRLCYQTVVNNYLFLF